MPPSILNLFLSGDRVPGACSGSVTGWPGIAVPPGSAHYPTKQDELTLAGLRAMVLSKRPTTKGSG